MSVDAWFPKPWMLPLLVAGLVLPAFAAFALIGPQLGVAVGALSIAALIVIAARSTHQGPIEVATGGSAPILTLALAPIEETAVASRIATLAEAGSGDYSEGYAVLVLAPATPTRLQRWLSDQDPGRYAAQERLAVSIATLTAAGCHAEGRVVDESPLQAVEDIAAQNGASRVVFVTHPGRDQEVVEQVRRRLDRPVDRVDVGGS